MRRKTTKVNAVSRFTDLHDAVQEALPHLFGWLMDEEEFVELRVKMMVDGTCLAIAKGYGPDGGSLVCFGQGYGALGALFGINGTIQSGSWRLDVPYEDRNKKK